MAIEQERQELMAGNPDLYAYIAAMEAIKALGRAIDGASIAIDVRRATNRIRSVRELYQRRAEVLSQK